MLISGEIKVIKKPIKIWDVNFGNMVLSELAKIKTISFDNA